jgi:hypothetical protein
MLIVLAWNNNMTYVFNDLQDNPSLYSYIIFYVMGHGLPLQTSAYLLPSALMLVYFSLIAVLMALSLKNKKYLSLLLAFVIISSIIFSINLYKTEVARSNDGTDNGISMFLNNNTTDRTIYLIDRATSYTNETIEMYKYGFWNEGEFGFVNATNISNRALDLNKTSYLISVKSLPYREIANDGNFKLYDI